MKRFSIITICKDNLNELKETYGSLVNQTSANFEWIVIDGNSSDGTKTWLSENTHVEKWISEPDKGIYDAMNKGVRMAEGEFLVFMNSGDEFYNDGVLEKVEKVLDTTGQMRTFIYGDSVDIDEHGKEHYRKGKNQTSIKFGMITQHQAMFFNRSHIPGTMYRDHYKLSADYAAICETIMSSLNGDILQVDFPICKFKMGGTNETKRFKAIKEDYNIRREILKLHPAEASVLYFLHFNHAIVKHLFKKTRFLRHKSMPANGIG